MVRPFIFDLVRSTGKAGEIWIMKCMAPTVVCVGALKALIYMLWQCLSTFNPNYPCLVETSFCSFIMGDRQRFVSSELKIAGPARTHWVSSILHSYLFSVKLNFDLSTELKPWKKFSLQYSQYDTVWLSLGRVHNLQDGEGCRWL